MRYYLGPWVKVTPDAGPSYWAAPAGTRGLVDLATLPDQAAGVGDMRKVGFFATDAVLPSEYTLLGDGDCRTIGATALMRSAWQSHTGYEPQGDLLVHLLWDQLTNGADPRGEDACKPLMPGVRLWMDLYLGGHSKVVAEKFEWGRPGSRGTDHTGKMRALLREHFRELHEAAQRGELRDKNGQVDREHHRKVLDFWCEKYKLNGDTDWHELVPPNLRAHVPGRLKHETTISDDFNRADENPLAGWTGIVSSHSVSSNKCVANANPAVSRHDSDLSSTDHYAQIDVVTNTPGGPIARKDSTGTQTFYMCWSESTIVVAVYKCIAGSFTQVGSNGSYSYSSPDTFKVECNGSAIKGYVNGSELVSGTDTAISSGLRCGQRSSNQGIGETDNFEAADLGASPVVGAGLLHGKKLSRMSRVG